MANINQNQLDIFVENNYGSIYKTTGGGKINFGGYNVTNWVKRILGNRVFDLYIKYLGVTTMTTATLVPVALILSKDWVESYLKNRQVGGFIPNNVPVIDNPLVGMYLKLAGLSVLNFTSQTLVPLGVAMIIYDLTIKNQAGGNLYGGGKVFTGSYIPPGPVQKMSSFFNDAALPEPLLYLARRDADFNNNLHLNGTNSSGSMTSNLSLLDSYIQPEYNGDMMWNDASSNLNSSRISNTVSADIQNEVPQQPNLTQSDLSIPKSMAGGYTRQRDASRRGRKKNRHNARTNDQKHSGGGSDWMSSQYSAGPINSPKMSNVQFRVFNKSNMNNHNFAKEYQKVPQELLIDTPLYKQNAYQKGLSSTQYGSSRETNHSRKKHPKRYSVNSSQYAGKTKL